MEHKSIKYGPVNANNSSDCWNDLTETLRLHLDKNKIRITSLLNLMKEFGFKVVSRDSTYRTVVTINDRLSITVEYSTMDIGVKDIIISYKTDTRKLTSDEIVGADLTELHNMIEEEVERTKAGAKKKKQEAFDSFIDQIEKELKTNTQ